MRVFLLALQQRKFQLEAISKIGFWFKIAAGPSFPALRDGPSDSILFVGLKPEVRLRRIGI
jgi:hypothetical protein